MRTALYVTIVAIAGLVGTLWLTTRERGDQQLRTTSASAAPPGLQRATPAEERDPAPTSALGAFSVDAAEKSREQHGNSANHLNRTGTPTPTAMPVDVSPGFESLLAPAVEPRTIASSMIVRRHRKLSSEERDEAWATRVEPGIRDYFEKGFVAQGLPAQRIEFVVIECRTTGCEIQAAGPAEDNAKPARDPQFLLRKMILGQFATDFESNNLLMTSTTLADGRLGYIAFLPRKQP